MKCRNCGSELKTRANFCDVCGMQIDAGDKQQASEQEKSKKKKMTAILISVISVALVAVIVTVVVLLVNSNNAKAELEEATQQFVPPAEAIEIDTTLDDPSNDTIQFKYDSQKRIINCIYELMSKEYELTYSYDDVGGKVVIETTFKKHPIKTISIDYNRVTRPDIFEAVDGYYLRLGKEYIEAGDAVEAETQSLIKGSTEAGTNAPTEPAARGFGIGRVVTEAPSEKATSAHKTEAPTTGGQHDPQAIPVIPDDLKDFVNQYGLYCAKDYDCRHAVEKNQNILSYIVNLHPCVQILNSSLYPGKGVTTSFSADEAVKSCPWDSKGTGAWTFDRQEVDWICVNIFHLPEKEIDTLYQKAYDEEKLWRDDDYYYILGLGKGDPMILSEIKSYQTDGVYYHVAYSTYQMNAQDMTQKGDEIASYYMVLEKKTIDGKEYWTMLYHSSDVPYVFEPFDING